MAENIVFMYMLFHNYTDNDRIILFTIANKLRHFTSNLAELLTTMLQK